MATRFICRICGQEFFAKLSSKRLYCSRKCYNEARYGVERPDLKGRKPWSTGLTAETDPRIKHGAQQRHKNVVDRDTLHELYVVQRLGLKTIGRRYGVTGHVIKRLVNEFELARTQRPYDMVTDQDLCDLYAEGYTQKEIGDMFSVSQSIIGERIRRNDVNGRGYRNKAAVDPSPELLRKLYWDEWLTYEEIGQRLNVDFTTIPYWLRKFNIPRRKVWETRHGPNWKQPDIEVIRHLYEAEGLSTHSIGQLFGVTGTAIKAWLKKTGVTLRKSGYPNISHYTANDGHKVKSGLELQADNWLAGHSIVHDYEPQIGNTPYKADFRVGSIYIEIWGLEGHEKYEQKRAKKLAVYQQLGLALISLVPKDFPHLQPLGVLLE